MVRRGACHVGQHALDDRIDARPLPVVRIDVEADHGVRVTRDLDLGFAWAAYRWADGQSLDRVLAGAEQAGTELSGGDFVRWARQLVDLLDQLAKVADGPVADAARAAVGRVRRGVVAVAVGG